MAYETKDITQLPVQSNATQDSLFLGGISGSDGLVVYPASSIDDIIPDKATEIQITSSGGFSSLTSPQQNAINKGALVILNNGSIWMYMGTGSKTDVNNYISFTDGGTW